MHARHVQGLMRTSLKAEKKKLRHLSSEQSEKESTYAISTPCGQLKELSLHLC